MFKQYWEMNIKMSTRIFTEDEVRDIAGKILGIKNCQDAKSGVGQITTFNQLGFKGVMDKPDGWYLPDNKSNPAILLETKASYIKLTAKSVDELVKNCKIINKKYKNVIGILYNHNEVRAFIDEKEIMVQTDLQNKEYYLGFFTQNKVDKQKIYMLTKRINNCLHFDFGIKNLYHRMVFTACALVATRYGATIIKGMDFATFHTSIHSTLSKSLDDDKKQNSKLDLLLEVYSEIKMNSTENQDAIDNFIKWVTEISDSINSDYWNGEDVMGIFFNEFNRYKKKSESGQVFTPDHITSFMYRLIEVNKDDVVLDAACGSGAFLVKAMCIMIREAGGVNTNKAKQIKRKQLYGIEFDREIYALACANMLIHKDGKTNLTQIDSRTQAACSWIKSKPIKKVLMNPPFENKYGCMTIVENVLDSVPRRTKCAFILPDKKLEKIGKAKPKRILQHHTLQKIIKLPEKLFFNAGITTSVFVFDSGIPQNGKDIFGCYIENDGLETVKNLGRQDIKDRWSEKENYWINVIQKQSGNDTIQWINPSEHLSYQLPEPEFDVSEVDFIKTTVDYLFFEDNTNVKKFGENLLYDIFYSGKITSDNDTLTISIPRIKNKVDIKDWKEFKIGCLFEIDKPIARVQTKYFDGETPFVASGNYNNGVLNYVQPETNEVLDKGECITVSPVDGSAFYQPVDFLGRGGAGSSILILRNNKINRFNAQFICTAIRITFSKYVYNDMGTGGKLKDEIIKLPADSKGQPDWIFMEKYMKELADKKAVDVNGFGGM